MSKINQGITIITSYEAPIRKKDLGTTIRHLDGLPVRRGKFQNSVMGKLSRVLWTYRVWD